jgi:predicted nucleic acid-binding Zn ribbon protein
MRYAMIGSLLHARKEHDPMALTQCPECQHEVSTLAAYCPNCGYVINQQQLPLSNDPDLARLVERERRRRETAPYIIIAAVVIVLVVIALARAT